MEVTVSQSVHLQKAVFLDRDGVLNALVDRGDTFRSPDGNLIRYTAPFRRSEISLLPNVHEALMIMKHKGYARILVTNQPDISTGHIDPEEFKAMMAIFRDLPLTDIYVCTHHPHAGCSCRKPKPGMLLSARDAHAINMGASFMIGDMETDIQAGRSAGVRTMLVTSDTMVQTDADHAVTNILIAALFLS